MKKYIILCNILLEIFSAVCANKKNRFYEWSIFYLSQINTPKYILSFLII